MRAASPHRDSCGSGQHKRAASKRAAQSHGADSGQGPQGSCQGPALKRARQRAPPAGLAAREVASKYKIHSIRLGSGTYGEVWQASCRQTGQEVAAKYVKRAEYGDDIEVFIREVNILKTLPRHQNIVELLDAFLSDWQNPDDTEELLCVIMMELCQSTLEKEWNKVHGRAPHSDADDWEGMAHGQSMHCIHCILVHAWLVCWAATSARAATWPDCVT